VSRRPARRVALGALVSIVVVFVGVADAQTPPPSPPPPTPVVVPGGGASPSPFPSTLRTPAPRPAQLPEIRAEAAVLADLDTGQVLFARKPNERRPIASLTKIMTALLVGERTEPTDVVTVSDDAASGRLAGISSLGLVTGERIRVNELLYALLLQSANDAAVALAEHVSGSVDAFVDDMNARARHLGLSRTMFTSPNGLDDDGYSSAGDLVRLTRAAYRGRGFASIVATRFHTVTSLDEPRRIVQNRNILLWLYPGAIGVKTGFTSAAGFCVVATAEREDMRLIAVVLGEPYEPFSDAAALLNYGFAAFDRRTLVEQGERLGVVEIGDREIPLTAGGSLRRLVPADRPIQRTVVLDEHVAYPPAVGSRIGILRLSAGGGVLGEVPAVVADVPPPPPPGSGPWWARAIGAVVDAGTALLNAVVG
jgi:serine-type D-Ala-D-Ala carboxypeptidase (penicillin-binding protein 5/6)